MNKIPVDHFCLGHWFNVAYRQRCGFAGEIPQINIAERSLPPIAFAHSIELPFGAGTSNREDTQLLIRWLTAEGIRFYSCLELSSARFVEALRGDQSIGEVIIRQIMRAPQQLKRYEQSPFLALDMLLPHDELPEKISPDLAQVEAWDRFLNPYQPLCCTIFQRSGYDGASFLHDGHYVLSTVSLHFETCRDDDLLDSETEPLFDFTSDAERQELQLSRDDNRFGGPTNYAGIYFPVPDINLMVGVRYRSMSDQFAKYYGVTEQLANFKVKNELEEMGRAASSLRTHQMYEEERNTQRQLLTDLLRLKS